MLGRDWAACASCPAATARSDERPMSAFEVRGIFGVFEAGNKARVFIFRIFRIDEEGRRAVARGNFC